jgi:hypothetical protein
LKVGDKYQEYGRTFVAGQGEGHLVLDTTVKDIQPTKITRHFKVSDVAGYTGIPQGAEADVVCEVDAQGKVNCTQSRLDLNLYNNCYVEGDPTSVKLTRGWLTLASGQTKKAYRITATFSGKLNADCALTGNADQTFVQFSSNDVPSPEFQYCGGTQLIQFNKLAQGGKTVRLDLNERRLQ